MDERTSGIILRARPLTETSLIVHWLTPDLGRLATVAKGARRPKSAFFGKLDLYYQAEFSFARSRRSDLHTLREAVLQKTRVRLRENLGWLAQAAYLGVLIELATEPETPLPELFDLMAAALDILPETPPRLEIALAFELKLLGLTGFEPDLAHARLSPPALRLAETLLESPWPAIAALPTDRSASELVRYLMSRIGLAFERIPPQRPAAMLSR